MLCTNGTNNKFTAEDVQKYQDYLEKLLLAVGIIVIGWSSDSDSRLLKVQRAEAGLGIEEEDGRSKLLYFNFGICTIKV